MLPQDEALDTLVEFLHVHEYEKVKGIDLETIRQLAAIVLQENVLYMIRKFTNRFSVMLWVHHLH